MGLRRQIVEMRYVDGCASPVYIDVLQFHENAILLEAQLRFAHLKERRTFPTDKLGWIREWVMLHIVPPSSFAHRSSYGPGI